MRRRSAWDLGGFQCACSNRSHGVGRARPGRAAGAAPGALPPLPTPPRASTTLARLGPPLGSPADRPADRLGLLGPIIATLPLLCAGSRGRPRAAGCMGVAAARGGRGGGALHAAP